jgi:hypothetical protein
MPLRFDAKTVLGMFNQSRLATAENEQRDKMAQINKDLEDRRMAESVREHDDAAGEARRQHDQTAAWHKDEVTRQGSMDAINEKRYADSLERQKQVDAANEAHIKVQEHIAQQQADTQYFAAGGRIENGKKVAMGTIMNDRMAATNQLMARLAEAAPDITPPNHETGFMGYLTDRAQKKNTETDEATAKAHIDFLNVAQDLMKDPKYAHIDVASIVGPLMAKSKAQLTGLLTTEAMDQRGDEDTFGGNWFGDYNMYASQDAYGRYNIQNTIHESLRRINANPYSIGK